MVRVRVRVEEAHLALKAAPTNRTHPYPDPSTPPPTP